MTQGAAKIIAQAKILRKKENGAAGWKKQNRNRGIEWTRGWIMRVVIINNKSLKAHHKSDEKQKMARVRARAICYV
jgi:hypothetical protein